MTLHEYQEKAVSTVQAYNSQDQENYFLGYLGLAGEAGSVLTTLKKLVRDGVGFATFKDKLTDELGDVLWYIAAIANHNNINLEEIARLNLQKTNDRFQQIEIAKIQRLDVGYQEKFPDNFVINFVEEHTQDGFTQVKMFWEKDENDRVLLGDPLTDNSRTPNNYRYHDVFHLGHIAFFGWSPVIRDLMKLKRRSDLITLDAEDRGRPQVAEEAVTLIVYNYAKSNGMLKESDRIDTDMLNTIKQLVVDLEVSNISSYHWEVAIINSYKVFHQIVENKGGRILVSPEKRELKFIGN